MAVAPPAENDPTWHSPETTDSPSCAQYLPGSQAVQEDVLAPDAEYDPAGHHPEMAVNPVPAQYFPASQGVQLLCCSYKPCSNIIKHHKTKRQQLWL